MQKNTNINFDDKPRKVRPSSGSRINTNTSLLHSKRNKYLATGAITFSLAFIVAYIASAEFMGSIDSDATTNVSASISSNGYYVNVTSLGEVGIDVNAASGGGKGEGSDLVRIQTNTSSYKLYVSTTDNSNNMYMNGDKSSTYYLDPTNTSGGELSVNSWGYRLSTDTDGFKPVPTKGSEALLTSQSGLAVGEDNNRTHSIIYGAKADLTLPAGRYSRTVLYSVVAEANAVANMASVSPSTVEWAESGNQQLTITIPMLTNMEYGEWSVVVNGTSSSNSSVTYTCSDVSVTDVNNKPSLTCTVPKHLAPGNYTVTAKSTKYGDYVSTNGLNYSYAGPSFFTITNLQDMNNAICATATKPNNNAALFDTDGTYQDDPTYVPQTILTDTRDDKKYVVQKMADGRCWMAQNLAIDGGTLITSEKSNVVEDYYLPNSTNFGDEPDSGSVANRNRHTDGDASSEGNPYSYLAATAGTGDSSIMNSNAPHDICPKNWRLPSVLGELNEFDILYNSYDRDKGKFSTAWHPVYGGFYAGNSASPSYHSQVGYWWSSTAAYANNIAYFLSVGTEDSTQSVSTNRVDVRRYGFNIRCIAK